MWQAKHGEREVIPQSSFFPLGFVNFELMNVLTGQNLLQNSDFSNDSASWLTFGGVSAVVPIVGGQALRANNFAWVQQNLPVSNIEVGQTYSLNARARTLSNCSVGFAGGGDNGRTFDERVSFRSNTWQEESLVVTMPEGTKWIAVYIASAKENCFVDELSLIAGDATAPVKNNRTIILNGSFEEGESFWNRFGGQSAITEGLTGQGYQADNFAWVQQDIPINLVEAGRRYILKGSAKTSGQSVCRVGIKFFGGGQTLVNTGFDFNSTDWEDKVVEFDLEAEPEWIAIFLATGRSSCTFDDLVLTTVETDAVPYDYLVASDAGEKGVWSEVADWPIIALHMALLGNGDVFGHLLKV